jgi:hypothetical protein
MYEKVLRNCASLYSGDAIKFIFDPYLSVIRNFCRYLDIIHEIQRNKYLGARASNQLHTVVFNDHVE